MNDAVERYSDGLAEGLAPELLETEAVSRKAFLREEISAQWEEFSQAEQAQVTAADRALLEMAEVVAVFWREDMIAEIRDREKIPEPHWWWWLDRIADDDYPSEYLPEAT